MRERVGVTWLRETFEVALESMDCEAECVVEQVMARTAREACELARRRQEEPERWCVLDVRSAVPTVSRGAA